MEQLSLALVGVLLIVLGRTNMTGNISTIHWYNRTKVTGDDVPKYGRVVGLGCVIMGVSFLITAGLECFVQATWTPVIALAGLAIGIGFILYGQFKYNKGIF